MSDDLEYLHDFVVCPYSAHGCREIYCSEEHRKSAWEEGHALLCAGVHSQKVAKAASTAATASPYQLFCDHATRHHEFFIFASIVMKIRSGTSVADALAPYSAFVQKRWWKIVNPEGGDSEEDDENMTKKRKRGAAAAEAASREKQKVSAQKSSAHGSDDDSSPSPAAITAHLRSVVNRSYDLLCAAIFTPSIIPSWLTRDWYARLIGCLRWNALAVEHSNPLADYIQMINTKLQVLEKAKRQRMKRLKRQQEAESEEEESSGEETSDEESEDDEKEDDDDDASNGDQDDDMEVTKAGIEEVAIESRAITSTLLPIIDRVMSTRAANREARRRRRAELTQSESKAERDLADSHSRIRPLERDSTELQKYEWTREYTSSQRVSYHFTNRLFPSYHGSALYPIISQLNHSCVPNATIQHAGDARGVVYAQCDIKKGEQLFISYINEDQGYDDRHDDLKEYGFNCKCRKCPWDEVPIKQEPLWSSH